VSTPDEVPEAAAAVATEVLVARAYLSRVAEPPALALAELVAEVGPVEAAGRVRAGRVGEQVAAETGVRRAVHRAGADLHAAAVAGARLVTPEHAEWPAEAFAAFALSGVRELAPPLALWVRGPGRLDALCGQAVAVVGARAATSYGAHVAGELGAGLADRGCTVVSGAAIGIDGAAHRGALAVQGPTLAVLACGVDRAYPASHQLLLERIAACGLVVSEYPPGAVPGRHRFLVRNRLIAGMAAGTVVVEAGLRSGAQRTASDALALGRPVMAVPGPVTSAMSAGCHRLVRDGALLVTRSEEVLEAVAPIGAYLAEPPVPMATRPTDGLHPAAARVHDALPVRAARDTRWLALEAGVPIGAVRVALVELERRGLVEHHGGRWRRTTRRETEGSALPGPVSTRAADP
jgi:DNA processing protein